MATVVNFRRLERLEAKTGGTGWVRQLSDERLEAFLLAAVTGENTSTGHLSQDENNEFRYLSDQELDDRFREAMEHVVPDAVRSCSNCPGLLDKVLNELQEIDAPKAATMLVEAVKEARLSYQ